MKTRSVYRGGWSSVVPLTLLAVIGSAQNSCAAGQVIAWGDSRTAVPRNAVAIRAIAAGNGFSVALKADGTLLTWGYGDAGLSNTPPPGLSNVSAVAAGDFHSLALSSDGIVAAWGYNFDGQIDVPRELTNIVAIAAGSFHSLALRSNGSLVAWGGNWAGQTDVPPRLTNAAAIAGGNSHSMALRSDGTVVAWGANWAGQTNVPSDLTDAVAIASGDVYCLALRSNGTVVAWGDNHSGQTDVPTGLADVAAIAAGGDHNLALLSNGTVVAWGNNSLGNTNLPPGLTNVIAIAAGFRHSLALLKDWPPVIFVQPISQSILLGRACTLSAAASSSEPFQYQWRLNGNALPGATNSELAIPAVQFTDAGVYSVVVSNALGSDTSQPAVLTVTEPAPSIIAQPVSQPFHVGENVTLQVLANGPGPITYQWLLGGIAIPGATNASLVISNASYGSRGLYTVTVSNPYGSVTSNPALLLLPFEKEFDAPEEPRIWDFSARYPSPLLTLQQDSAGLLVNDAQAHGWVWQNGSCISLHLITTRPNGYFIQFSPTHIEIILEDTCTAALILDPIQRRLIGTNACVTIGQEFQWFLFTWAAYRNLTTNRSSALVNLPLPDEVTGHWRLALDVVPSGNRLTGRAFIVLSSSNVISLDVTGTISPVNKSVMVWQNSPNRLTVVTAGPEISLLSMHGNLAGQGIDYDAPVRTSPLTVNINGDGRVALPRNAQALLIGKDYTLHAAPRPGNLFSNWIVAGIVVNNPTLRFTMSSNLLITANFVTNSFIGLKGNYTGLFYDTNALSHASAGLFSFALTDSGTFSGRLQQGAAKHPFSGRFDLGLSVQRSIARRGTNEVVVRLQLKIGSDQILGTVSNASWVSESFGYRSAFSSPAEATNFQGAYTVLLPGAAVPEDGQMGHGCGRMSVSSAGSVSFKGTLGDGGVAVQKVPLAANGQWPFYVSLYSGKGSVFGWLTLVNTPTNEVIGPLWWTKPVGAKGSLYPAGFTNEVEMLGSRYVRPAPGARVLDFTNAALILHGGNLAQSLPNTVALDERNKLTVTSTNVNRLALTVSLPTGAFSGNFVHPQLSKWVSIKGVLLQKQNLGGGFFIGTNQSGSVNLIPEP